MAALRRRPGGGDGSQDPDLPFLTVAEADRVRFLARQAFAESGREVAVHGGHVRDDHGDEFGLWNVAAACHSDPRGEPAWALIVAEHVRKLVAHVDHRDLTGLTPGEAQSRTYAKLFRADDFPSREGFSYLRDPVPGLVEGLVVDFPDAVSWLRDSEVERFGGLARLREAGLANLRALPVEQRRHMAAPDGATFEVLLGESVYTASRVLVMPDLLAQLLGPVDARHGVLAAIAARNQVAIHVISGRSAVPSLRLMARFALTGFADGTGPLSPDVFWWRDGTWTQITTAENDGTISVLPNPDLMHTIQQFDDR
jgi:hypothetical protein